MCVQETVTFRPNNKTVLGRPPRRTSTCVHFKRVQITEEARVVRPLPTVPPQHLKVRVHLFTLHNTPLKRPQARVRLQKLPLSTNALVLRTHPTVLLPRPTKKHTQVEPIVLEQTTHGPCTSRFNLQYLNVHPTLVALPPRQQTPVKPFKSKVHRRRKPPRRVNRTFPQSYCTVWQQLALTPVEQSLRSLQME